MLGFLTIVVLIVMAIGVVVRLMKVLDLAGELRGKTEEEVTESDNQMNGIFFILFMLFLFGITIYQVVKYRSYMMTPPASEHGHIIDDLMYFTFRIIGIVFFITQTVLFFFAYKYHSKKDSKAYYYSHNNKLEMIWTIIPTIVLTAMIVYGLLVWDIGMTKASEDSWLTKSLKEMLFKDYVAKTKDDKTPIVIEIFSKQYKWVARYSGNDNELGRFSYKMIQGVNELGVDSADAKAWDDVIVSAEFHLPVNRPVEFHFRSQDVLHGVFMPYFRAQINSVPGMTTRLQLKPTITTAEMKKIMKNEAFDYLLLCNKHCGSAHYTMQMNIVVESEDEFNKWIKDQKIFKSAETPKTAVIVTDSLQLTTHNSQL